MADLTLRFDDVIETHYDRQLAQIREWTEANQHTIPSSLSIEIGSHRGQFLRQLAARHPDGFYLGVEIRKKWTEQANKRFERYGLTNAHVIRADAAHVIPIVVDDGQLGELFVLYPDPWWKARHKKRRVIRKEMLDMLSPKFAPHGKLWVRTDVGPLANDMRATLNAHPDFEPLPLADYPLSPFPFSERDVVTMRNDLPVQLLYYRKRA